MTEVEELEERINEREHTLATLTQQNSPLASSYALMIEKLKKLHTTLTQNETS